MIKIINLNCEIPSTSGIYKFTNIINGKFYIGSSQNLRKRFFRHLALLKNNNHHSNSFQNAWNKYGEDNFQFEIIEFVEKIENLLFREQHYLDTLLFAQDYVNKINTKFIELGYNINPTSSSRLGTTQSENSIRKSVLNNPNRKEILQFDFNGNFIKEWESSANAAKNLNLYKSGIHKCCKNYSDYCGNYIFIYKDDLNLYEDYFNSLKDNPYVKQVWNKGLKIKPNKENFEFILFDRYGRYIDLFKFQTEICNEIKCTPANLSRAKNNKVIKDHYVFDVSFNYEEFINKVRTESEIIFNLNCSGSKVLLYDIFGNFITSFSSVKEASELTELNENSIYNVLCKKRKQIKGYIFKYNDDIV